MTALRAPQGRELVAAQAKYDRTKRELEAAKTERDRLIAKHMPKFPIGEWITVGGWVLRITMQPGGDRFKLGDYLKHHKLTAAMRPFITPGGESPRLWIKPSG